MPAGRAASRLRPGADHARGCRRKRPCTRPLHVERHFTASETVRDVVIGMSDGLTVPFALAAGLSGTAVATTAIIVTAGLAEVAAGSIAMGLGGYLAARSDAEHFANEKLREEREVQTVPDVEELEVAEVFQQYGLTDAEIEPILRAFRNNHPAWVDFMMRFELGLEEPDPRRGLSSALTIAGAYIAGRPDPAVPLHGHQLHPDRPARLGRGDAGRAPGLRLRQGAVHRHPALAECRADDADRRGRRRGGVPDRAGLLVSLNRPENPGSRRAFAAVRGRRLAS